jgi:hypothetical protein
MLLLLSVFLVIAPEQAMSGSSIEPARSLPLIFASRTFFLAVLIALAITRKREALAWAL